MGKKKHKTNASQPETKTNDHLRISLRQRMNQSVTIQGTISKYSSDGQTVCIRSPEVIEVGYIYTGPVAGEDHLWVDAELFTRKQLQPEDIVCFEGVVYEYRNKKDEVNYGVKDINDVKRINPYSVIRNWAESMVCEVCLFSEHCYGFCLRGEKDKEGDINNMALSLIPALDPEIMKWLHDHALYYDLSKERYDLKHKGQHLTSQEAELYELLHQYLHYSTKEGLERIIGKVPDEYFSVLKQLI